MLWFFSSKTFRASGFMSWVFFFFSLPKISFMPFAQLTSGPAPTYLVFKHFHFSQILRETYFLSGMCGLSCAQRPHTCFQTYTDPQYFSIQGIFYPVFFKYRTSILGLNIVGRYFNLFCSIRDNLNTCGHLKHFSTKPQKRKTKG